MKLINYGREELQLINAMLVTQSAWYLLFSLFQMCRVVPGPDIYLLSYLQQQTGHFTALSYQLRSSLTVQFKTCCVLVIVQFLRQMECERFVDQFR